MSNVKNISKNYPLHNVVSVIEWCISSVMGQFCPKIESMHILIKNDFFESLVNIYYIRRKYVIWLRIRHYVMDNFWNIFHTWHEKMLPCENQPYQSTNRILGFLGFLSPNALIITYGQTWSKYSLGNANSPKKFSARSDHFWAKNMLQHAHRCSKNFCTLNFYSPMLDTG